MLRLFVGLLVAASLIPRPVAAQEAPRAPATGGVAPLCAVRRVPECRTTVATFEELSAVVRPGQQLIVTDESGRTGSGRILSISPSEVVLERGRFLILVERNRFDGQAVNEVRFRDSTLNGELFGMLAGVIITGITGALTASEEGSELAMLWVGTLVVPAAAVIGWLVDGLQNATIYERAPRTPEVRIAPLAGRRSAGVELSVRF